MKLPRDAHAHGVLNAQGCIEAFLKLVIKLFDFARAGSKGSFQAGVFLYGSLGDSRAAQRSSDDFA